jgi:hypothetical protein
VSALQQPLLPAASSPIVPAAATEQEEDQDDDHDERSSTHNVFSMREAEHLRRLALVLVKQDPPIGELLKRRSSSDIHPATFILRQVDTYPVVWMFTNSGKQVPSHEPTPAFPIGCTIGGALRALAVNQNGVPGGGRSRPRRSRR